jgi:hypothetical protein
VVLADLAVKIVYNSYELSGKVLKNPKMLVLVLAYKIIKLLLIFMYFFINTKYHVYAH